MNNLIGNGDIDSCEVQDTKMLQYEERIHQISQQLKICELEVEHLSKINKNLEQ